MTVNLGLSVSDVVSVAVSLSPVAASERNFGNLLILGDSGVIDTTTRLRLYTSLSGVIADFGSSAPEALAATVYFGQANTPAVCYVGAWARTATSGRLVGGPLSAAQQAITVFTSIATGSMAVTVDATVHTLAGMNFTAQSNLNGVASIITTALAGSATVTWDSVNSQFNIKSSTTGASSSVGYASATGTGTDVSALLNLTLATGSVIAPGIIAETALAAATIAAGMTNNWYGLTFASSIMPQDSDYVSVAGFIQGTSISHVFGVTTQEAAALVSTNSTDIGSQLQALKYTRTFVQFSSSNPYACCASLGIAFCVQFTGSNTTLTLKFQPEAGVVAETLTEAQAAVLNAKNINVFVQYNNSTAILQQGVMASGQFFDVVQGTDWLQNFIQTAVYNLLYLTTTKIPQTDSGVNMLVSTVASCCSQAVINGLASPGVWNGPAVGALAAGQSLPKGYYVYAPPVASQSAAARGARQSPVITACLKLAGAIHSASVILNVSN